MKIDLAGLAAAAARELPRRTCGHLIFALEELAQHVRMARENPDALDEFARLYTLKKDEARHD